MYSRGGIAEVGAPLQLPEGESLEGADGLVLRLRADEHAYTCVLRVAGGALYTNRFGTRVGYNTLRLPFNTFRPVNADDPLLRPGEQPGTCAAAPGPPCPCPTGRPGVRPVGPRPFGRVYPLQPAGGEPAVQAPAFGRAACMPRLF